MRSFAVLVAALLCVAAPPAAADFPNVPGWTPHGEVQTYDRSNLWEYIDGAADMFLACGFELLATRNLAADGVVVTVNIYDMGTPLNAFGAYTVESPDDAPAVAAGVAASLSLPYHGLLLKDRFYVKVDAYEGEIDLAGGTALLSALAAALPGSDEPPPATKLLPEDGRVPGSEGYAREGFLGLAELTGCVHASYAAADGESYRVFVLAGHGEDSPEDVWQRLRSRWIAVDHPRPVLAKRVPYRGLVGVTRTERGIMGVADCASKAELLERLDALAE